MLIDSHCHLDYPPLYDELPSVIDKARFENIHHMLSICTKVREVTKIKEIAYKYDMISYSVGTHPHEASNEQDITAEEIMKHIDDDKCLGIGECGLDYFYEYSEREVQKKVFIEHINAAQSSSLPLIIHARDAEDDISDIINSEYKNKAFSGLIHCFTGSIEFAKFALDHGLFISFSGVVTFKKADDLRDVVKYVPLDRILIETDAPYLAPDPHRGKTNEPSYIVNTATKVAEVKGVSFEKISQVTTENFAKLFTKFKNFEI